MKAASYLKSARVGQKQNCLFLFLRHPRRRLSGRRFDRSLRRELVEVDSPRELDGRFGDCRQLGRRQTILGLRRCEESLKARQCVWHGCLEWARLGLLLIRKLYRVRDGKARRTLFEFDKVFPVSPIRACPASNGCRKIVDVLHNLGAPIGWRGVSHGRVCNQNDNYRKQDNDFHNGSHEFILNIMPSSGFGSLSQAGLGAEIFVY